jgi:hypothetical protein
VSDQVQVEFSVIEDASLAEVGGGININGY